jgi:hypothetical protein
VRISARRLALIVLGAAAVGVAMHYAFSFVLGSRNDTVGLEIGLVGNLVLILLFPLVPILVIVAGILAIRRRPATRVEIVLCCILGGLFGAMGALAAFESLLGPVEMFTRFDPRPASLVWDAAPVLGVLVVLVVPVLFVAVIVQTIRAPGRTATTPER